MEDFVEEEEKVKCPKCNSSQTTLISTCEKVLTPAGAVAGGVAGALTGGNVLQAVGTGVGIVLSPLTGGASIVVGSVAGRIIGSITGMALGAERANKAGKTIDKSRKKMKCLKCNHEFIG